MNNLKFLVIPDSFKDCMPASQVGENIKKGILNVFKDSDIQVLSIADGGEGTVESIINVVGGKIINIQVLDPIGRITDGFFGIINDEKTAIIEMAAASGLEKLSIKERNPWITSTYGTGQLIKAALDHGCEQIIVGIGGSATNDGGMGMAKALGIRFYDSNKKELDDGGGSLVNLATIDESGIDKRISNTKIIAATDVNSPLIGKAGASLVFGSQKGATIDIVKKLEYNLTHFAKVVKNHYLIDIAQIKGGGAAGGLGAGLHVFLNAEIRSGFDSIAELIDLDNKIKHTDIIITAEGKFDNQTIKGKTPIGVGKLALKYNKPLFVFTGNDADNILVINSYGITCVLPIIRKPVSLNKSILLAPKWLEKSAEDLCQILKLATKLKN